MNSLVRTSERYAGCGDGRIRWPMLFLAPDYESALHPRHKSAPADDDLESRQFPAAATGNFFCELPLSYWAGDECF